MAICYWPTSYAIKSPLMQQAFLYYSFISFLRSVILPSLSCRVRMYKPAGRLVVLIVLLLPDWVITTLPIASVSFTNAASASIVS